VVRSQNGSAICGRLTLEGPVADINLGLMHGEIAARWCDGKILPTEEGSVLSGRFHVRTDGTYESKFRTKVLLVLEDWAYFFLLLVPVNPTETNPTVFHRGDVVLMMTPESNAELTWELYIKIVNLV